METTVTDEGGKMDWHDAVVLVTGGTGSFGRKFIEIVLSEYDVRKLIIFSRDELKQHEMRVEGFNDPRLRYFIGDVRDLSRLRRATKDVDVLVHAAALKQVPACEYNPIEAINTNINGARNVIEAALDNDVQRVMAVSTDKAVSPVNLYGATKLCAEKLFVHSNVYAGGSPVRFSCVRYGNVVGSRGSVIPLFKRQRESGRITITDPRMTRFWITLEQGIRFVIKCIEQMRGGEVFVPKIPSMNIMELARALAPGCEVQEIGIRPGEKVHEVLVSEEEARRTLEMEDMFVIEASPRARRGKARDGAEPVADGFQYGSELNDEWLETEDFLKLIVSEE